MSIKIYVLEDDKYRIDYFKQFFVGFDIDFTDIASQAIIDLKNQRYDFIFLDHDLGTEIENNNGEFVCRNLIHSVNKSTQIIIHSMNPVGAQNMFNSMKSDMCVIAPFQSKSFNVIMSQIKNIGGFS